MKCTNVQRYLQLVEDLSHSRQNEAMLLDKMDLLWQAMSLEDRKEVQAAGHSWPRPTEVTDPEKV